MSKHVSFDPVRQAAWGNAMAANRIREIRLSGMKRGAWGNMGQGGTRNPPHIPKGCVSETLHLKLRAPQLYPDPFSFFMIDIERELWFEGEKPVVS